MRVLAPLLAVALLALLVVSGLAWQRAGAGRAEGLAAQALGMSEVLRDAAEEALRGLDAAEESVAGRLAAAARRAAAALELGERPARDLLEQVAREERVGALAWVDADGSLRALAHGGTALAPATPEAAALRAQAEALEREELTSAARTLAPAPGDVRTEGLTQNRFASRERFGVALGLQGGGVLLLRAEAGELGALKRRLGLEPVLTRVAGQPGVASARLIDEAGRVLLDGAAGRGAGGPGLAPPGGLSGGARTLEDPAGQRALAPFTLPDGTRAAVDLVLLTGPVERDVAAARGALALGAGVALLGLLGAGLWIAARDRRRRREEARAARTQEDERRLVEMGALAGLVTHELANPLNSVRLGLPLLAGDLPREQRERVAATVAGEAARMGRTLETFLGLARQPGSARERLDGRAVERLLARVAERTSAEAERRGVALDVEAAPDLPPVDGEPLLLEQALTNLVRNALAASRAGGRVRLAAERSAAAGELRLLVDDRGAGFPAQGREALLAVGAAGRPGGHGLGLPLAARFVRQHGGRLSLLDRPGGGARAEACLPAAPSTVPPARSPA